MKNLIQKIVLFIFICILLFISYTKFILKEDVIKIGGIATFVVLTGSMEPTIQAGEMIVVKEENAYQIGDIVTYREEKDFLVTHRIVKIDGENITTKGDNNNLEDKTIKEGQILGKVIFQSKLCGFIILYLLKPITLILIIFLLVQNTLFQILNEKTIKEVKNTENKK